MPVGDFSGLRYDFTPFTPPNNKPRERYQCARCGDNEPTREERMRLRLRGWHCRCGLAAVQYDTEAMK